MIMIAVTKLSLLSYSSLTWRDWELPHVPIGFVYGSGMVTVVLASTLLFVLRRFHHQQQNRQQQPIKKPNNHQLPLNVDDGSQHLKNGTENGKLNLLKNIPEDADDATEYPGGRLYIYFATETGTAESFARQLEREAPTHGFHATVVDLEDTSASLSDLLMHRHNPVTHPSPSIITTTPTTTTTTTRAIFLTATYGEGESPGNARGFVQTLQETSMIDLSSFTIENASTYTLENENGSPFDKKKENVKAVENSAIDKVSQRQPSLVLCGLDYCVFGLGNRQYERFNAMGKYVDHTLDALGANRILELGLGDDDKDLEADFETWKEERLWQTLRSLYLAESSEDSSNLLKNNIQALANGAAAALRQEPPPASPYSVKYLSSPSLLRSSPEKKVFTLEKVHGQSRHYFTCSECRVLTVRELRSTPTVTDSNCKNNDDNGDDNFGSTVHIELDASEAGLTYQTADNLGIIPENESSVVEAVATSLNFQLDQVFELFPVPGREHDWHGLPFPMPISVRECLTRYCDLTGSPRRADLKLLAAYAIDSLDRAALLRMSSKEGKAEYKEKIVDEYVGIADLLRFCPSIRLSLEQFIHICPLLQTRFYTISSSSSVHPNTIHLTVAVTRENRKSKHHTQAPSIFLGLCSHYLARRLVPGVSRVRAFVRPSIFRLPPRELSSVPILLIGPGTGIAPMRALLQERQYQRQQYNSSTTVNDDNDADSVQKRIISANVGPNILYFGCRDASRDFLYREELQRLRSEGDLHQLHVAVSRQQPDRKVYVQNLLADQAAETWTLLHHQGAYVYVCGGVQMGHDVAHTLREIVATHLLESSVIDSDIHKHNTKANANDTAKDYLLSLTQRGRYVQELWA